MHLNINLSTLILIIALVSLVPAGILYVLVNQVYAGLGMPVGVFSYLMVFTGIIDWFADRINMEDE